MDLSANRQRVSPEERARRLAEGRCYRCGGLGHFSVQCPLGNSRQSRPLRAAEVSHQDAPTPVNVEPLN